VSGSEVVALKAPAKERSRPQGVVAQLPITSFADWDKVWQIREVLRSFEGGNDFSRPAQLVDSMLRDDRVFGITSTRVGALVASGVDFRPASKKGKAKNVAEILGGSDDLDGEWERICPPHAVGELLMWGLMLGIGVGELVWETTADKWTPTLRVWHPQFLTWHWKEGVYKLRTADGFVTLPSPEQQGGRLDGKWVVWTPYGYRDGWRRALLRPLAMLYLCRQWAYRDWAQYNEKHGNPTDVGFVPEGAPPEEKGLLADMLAGRGANAAIILPRGENEHQSYDVKLLEATGNSYQSFKEQINKLETDIAVAVLGQNLSTEVKEGSRAAAEVHDGVRLVKRREDARIGRCLREQILTHWAEHNFGDPELAPRVCYEVDDPEDDLTEVQTMEGVGAAILTLRSAGLAVDAEAMADRFGVPLLPLDEREAAAGGGAAAGSSLTPTAASAIIKVNEGRGMLGLPPLLTATGELDPDGEMTVAEFLAKNADVIGKAVRAETGEGGGSDVDPESGGGGGGKPPGGGGGGGAAPQGDPATKLPKARVERNGGDGLAGLGRQRTVAGRKRMATYASSLEKVSQLRARHAMAVDLEGIQAEIAAATDFDDLRKRVVARYKGRANNAALARIVERARIMAHMAGRLGAVEDL
jgi:hypothetical protein